MSTLQNYQRRTYPYDTESQSVTSAAEVSLTSPGAETVNWPSGTTIYTAMVIATLKATNQDFAEHNIGVTLQRNYNAGGWVDVRDLTANPPLSLPTAYAVSDSVTITEDVTAVLVASGGTIDFRWQVDSDDASEVHYTSEFVLIVEFE